MQSAAQRSPFIVLLHANVVAVRAGVAVVIIVVVAAGVALAVVVVKLGVVEAVTVAG